MVSKSLLQQGWQSAPQEIAEQTVTVWNISTYLEVDQGSPWKPHTERRSRWLSLHHSQRHLWCSTRHRPRPLALPTFYQRPAFCPWPWNQVSPVCRWLPDLPCHPYNRRPDTDAERPGRIAELERDLGNAFQCYEVLCHDTSTWRQTPQLLLPVEQHHSGQGKRMRLSGNNHLWKPQLDRPHHSECKEGQCTVRHLV